MGDIKTSWNNDEALLVNINFKDSDKYYFFTGIKTCNCCGKHHVAFKKDKTKTNDYGLWYNCTCGSTLFIDEDRIR